MSVLSVVCRWVVGVLVVAGVMCLGLVLGAVLLWVGLSVLVS